MNILKDPVELAEELRAQAACDGCYSRFIVFGDWCHMFGAQLPEIYVKAVASHLVDG